MALAGGARLGPYEVVESIGEGGMGQVYRARDTKLNRDVALKVLLDSVVTDPDRLARFQREAELLASLNHPNIAQIYGLEDSGETTALVLELIEGPTLAERIRQGPIPLDEAIPIATQIAVALEAAHEQGIIHRDLKPANIKLTPNGTVKVLDFGLAKALDETTGTDPSESPTMATAVTGMGVIMGTAAYMSPEQARGKPVDRRADIWAFGVVLYEMLTGKRAFEAEDVSLTLAEVMKSEPDWDALPKGVSPTLQTYLKRCFAKNPAERIRDIGDVRLALSGALDVEAELVPVTASVASRSGSKWIAATAVLMVVAAIAAWLLRPPVAKPVVRFHHDLADGQGFAPGAVLALSRDGSQLVFNTTRQLFVRGMDETVARPIAGTEGEGIWNPVFSPDGEWIAYYSMVSRQVKKIPVGGGAAVSLADSETLSAMDWGLDDSVVYATRDGVFRVSGLGGVPARVGGSDLTVSIPRVLPGGAALLAVRLDSDGTHIGVLSVTTGKFKDLFEGEVAAYVSTGHIVFAREEVLFAVPFDVSSLEVTGNAVQVAEGVGYGIGRAGNGFAQFVVSESGALAYHIVTEDAGGRARVLGLANLGTIGGSVEILNVPQAEYSSPRLSPDGTKLAVQTLDDRGVGTLWVYELGSERALQQLTFEGDNSRPVWTPDGARLTFASNRDGDTSIYWKPADGSGSAERLTTAEVGLAHFPSSWSPDGSLLTYMVRTDSDDWSIWTRSAEGEQNVLYGETDVVYMSPEFSPDGKWLAYQSGERVPQQSIYVEPFPPTGAKHKISPERGNFPMWSPSGTQLFYRNNSSARNLTLRSVDITLAPNFGFTYERTLPLERFVVVPYQRDYDISPDGQKLLMVYPADPGESARPAPRIQIVLNWVEELKARVPVN